ncbi:protein of unknown function [Streptomyces murinus]
MDMDSSGTTVAVGTAGAWAGSRRGGPRSGRSGPVGRGVRVGRGSGPVGLALDRGSGPGGIGGGADPGGGRGAVMCGRRSWLC